MSTDTFMAGSRSLPARKLGHVRYRTQGLRGTDRAGAVTERAPKEPGVYRIDIKVAANGKWFERCPYSFPTRVAAKRYAAYLLKSWNLVDCLVVKTHGKVYLPKQQQAEVASAGESPTETV